MELLIIVGRIPKRKPPAKGTKQKLHLQYTTNFFTQADWKIYVTEGRNTNAP